MVDGVATHIEHITAVTPVKIGHFAGAPVLGGDKSDRGTGESKALPPFHLVDLFKTQAVDQVPHAGGNDDRLVGGNLSQAFSIEMVEVGMGDENQVDIRQVMAGQARMPKTTDDQKPIGPVRIHQDVSLGPLNQERGVSDPGDADLPVLWLWENRGLPVAMAPFPGEKGRQEHIGDEAMGALSSGWGAFLFQGAKSCPCPPAQANARGDGSKPRFSLSLPNA